MVSDSCDLISECVASNTGVPNMVSQVISCAQHASCDIVDGTRTCVCDDGYEGDGNAQCRGNVLYNSVT